MKKICKISRTVLTLLLAIAIMAGSSSMTASATERALCNHPLHQTRIGNRTEESHHRVQVGTNSAGAPMYVMCYVTKTYQTIETYCTTCKLITSVTDTALLEEKHSLSH